MVAGGWPKLLFWWRGVASLFWLIPGGKGRRDGGEGRSERRRVAAWLQAAVAAWRRAATAATMASCDGGAALNGER